VPSSEGPRPCRLGTLFDNILITDDSEYAMKFAKETWGIHKDVYNLCI
jgi:hypothetical protein